MADDEFSDEIDWSEVPLNSISASMSVPRATTPGGAPAYGCNQTMNGIAVGNSNDRSLQHRHSTGNAAIGGIASTNNNAASQPHHQQQQQQQNVGYQQPPQHSPAMVAGGNGNQNHSRMSTGSMGMQGRNAMPMGGGINPDALRRQVRYLCNPRFINAAMQYLQPMRIATPMPLHPSFFLALYISSY